METKAANFEGEMIRMKEHYRELDNERQKKFMRQRFDVQETRYSGGRGQIQGGPQRNNVASRLQESASLTETGTRRLNMEEAARGLEIVE